MTETVRLPKAAYACRTTAKSVAHWCAKHPTLSGDHAPSAWNAYSPALLLRLATVRRLLMYGLTTEEAVEAVANSLDVLLAPCLRSRAVCPWPHVLSLLDGETMTFSRSFNRTDVSLAPVLGDDRGDSVHGCERLVLDLTAIAADCMERLAIHAEVDAQLGAAALANDTAPATPANDTAQPCSKGHA